MSMPQTKHAVLVIDDETNMLKTYKAILKKSYEITTINNGPEALEMLKRENFSLVLLDVMMPDMNGIEVLKKIKELDKNIEVVMITGVKDIKMAVQAIKLGAYDYITKPFEIEDLLSVISKALERR